jgi:hypothetical protein
MLASMACIAIGLWLALAAATPGVRNAHAMAYDEARGVTVLYGGADERAVRGDTWAWDGARWRRVARGGPPARTFPVLVADAARRELLLFGGNRVLFGTDADLHPYLGDTWSWDGARWRARRVAGPEPRAEAAAAYDRARGRVVLFGGLAEIVDGKRRRFGDTWEWDGRAWTQVASSGPSARSGAAMAFDERRGRVVLFGGSGPPPSDETWEWDGARWERVAGATAPGRFNSAAAFDAARGRVLRFGGWDGKGRVAESWWYDGAAWTPLEGDGPSARNHAALAFDRRRGRVVLHGGHDGERIFGDTWEHDGTTWRRAAAAPPLIRVENGH